jgi:hypothetical protein
VSEMVHPEGFDSGAVREHRRPQVEKRKATHFSKQSHFCLQKCPKQKNKQLRVN